MPTFFALPFPVIDPVIVSIGPLAIRWYALAYIAGLLFAVWYVKQLLRNASLWGANQPTIETRQVDDLLLWVTLGVVLGGRIGYVAFYNPGYFAAHPGDIMRVWEGGMSFHGGLIGAIAASAIYGRRNGVALDRLLDLGGAAAPIGIGLGRLANFIKPELWGRVSDVPWAMVFPGGGELPRHPSQLYEAALEGLLLFIILRVASHRYMALSRPGLVIGLFAVGYGLSRIIVEFAREPDKQPGFIAGNWLTMGMLLSLPLVAAGCWLILRARRPA